MRVHRVRIGLSLSSAYWGSVGEFLVISPFSNSIIPTYPVYFHRGSKCGVTTFIVRPQKSLDTKHTPHAILSLMRKGGSDEPSSSYLPISSIGAFQNCVKHYFH